MKSIVAAFCCVILLSGCETMPERVKIQEQYIPVYVCPAPPDVPQIEFEVDKLVQEGKTRPSDGEIAQAYKHDMTYLRETHKIYELILDQYRKSGKDFETAKKEIQIMLERIRTEKAKEQPSTP